MNNKQLTLLTFYYALAGIIADNIGYDPIFVSDEYFVELKALDIKIDEVYDALDTADKYEVVFEHHKASLILKSLLNSQSYIEKQDIDVLMNILQKV